MKRTPLASTIILSLILILTTSFVCAVPMIPTVFNGTVTYTGDTGMNLYGYDINFTIGSSYGPVKAGSVSSGNNYEVDVDPNGNTGQDIKFFIGGSEANEVGTYIKGGFVTLDLTIDEPPTQIIDPEYCGDGICNNGETCSTCSQDCGQCGDGDGNDDGNEDNENDNDGSSDSDDDDDETSGDVIILSNSNSNSDTLNSGQSNSGQRSPMTGSVVGDSTEKSYGFLDFLESGGLIVILAGMIIVLGIIMLLLPKR
ncbi:hypothetical protein GF378_03250 [Candidatus Pacearchaeota archaeon]|nr:hypothetical protein [Candidatus Pacearchaeota archaeon]